MHTAQQFKAFSFSPLLTPHSCCTCLAPYALATLNFSLVPRYTEISLMVIVHCCFLCLESPNLPYSLFQTLTILCPTPVIPWACQAPLSMGFSRQEYWSSLPFPSPRNLPNPGIKPGSPALTIRATREAQSCYRRAQVHWRRLNYKVKSWVKKKTEIHPQTGIPLSNKKEWTIVTHNNMDEYQNNYTRSQIKKE